MRVFGVYWQKPGLARGISGHCRVTFKSGILYANKSGHPFKSPIFVKGTGFCLELVGFVTDSGIHRPSISKVRRKWIFRFKTGTGRADQIAAERPGLPFARLRTALRLRPRRALASAEVNTENISQPLTGRGASPLFHFYSHHDREFQATGRCCRLPPPRASRFPADQPKPLRTKHVGLVAKLNDGHATENSEEPGGPMDDFFGKHYSARP